uniref:Isoamyl acetatehydrolyzing esterase 1 putative n=1 Tax=Albugo laibachii Nc14 TaxID=890382 RepID=F0WMM1_9STRA|nr:isoamyl acetatehydrolyzing esterase 1 putative [Albugo laibachii Nc14]|eukprot:CCA22553.1 isoamyl acetatehydrolyzing esterase 1 putative [Albugo laibachii Nc14]
MGAKSTSQSGNHLMRPSIVLCGDSLTQLAADPRSGGFMCFFINDYVRSVDVLNRGFSGYTTKQYKELVIPVLKEDFASRKPCLLTLWLGANDAALIDGPAKAQHVPLPEYRENLGILLKSLLEINEKARILLITPPAVIDDMRAHLLPVPGKLDRSNAEAGRYAVVCKQVGEEFKKTNKNIVIMDVYESINAMKEEERRTLYADGLHFSSLGNFYIYKEISKVIQNNFPELHPDNVPPQVPAWDSSNPLEEVIEGQKASAAVCSVK